MATLAALVLAAATAVTTWALTRPDAQPAAVPVTTTPTPTATEAEREQHAHDTMTSADERDWLDTYERLDDQLIRTALLDEMAPILAEDGYTVDDLEAFAPGFCASVEQVGMVTALIAIMTEPDPDNPGKLRPVAGNPSILAVAAVRIYCPWYVAEFDRAIET